MAGIPDSRVEEVLEQTEMSEAGDRRYGKYSMGMRQRIGLAAALLGEPRILVLDEPANGLDPAGIIEFRDLVRSLVAEGRTVWLSSHLLDEVEKTCDVAAIVDSGHVVAQGTIAELKGGGSRAIDIAAAPRARAAGLLAGVPEVTRAHEHDGVVRVELAPGAPPASEMVTALLRRLLEHEVLVERVAPVAASLEDRFLDLTTRLEDRS